MGTKVYSDAVLGRVSDADFYTVMSDIGGFEGYMRDAITIEEMIYNHDRKIFMETYINTQADKPVNLAVHFESGMEAKRNGKL